MNRKAFAKICMGLTLLFALDTGVTYGQQGMMGGYGGMGMMGGYGMGMMGNGVQINIPDKLEKPQSAEWIARFKEVYALEKMSQAQYEADRIKYKVQMPYAMIGLQEIDHIAWIEGLFAAYGIALDVQPLAIKETANLAEAYKNGMQLEENLVRLDEQLLENAPDETTADVVETILFQTRIHYTMFNHALQMAGWERKGRIGGYGGMGMHHQMMGEYGRMGGYGMGMGAGMMGGYGARTSPECNKYYDATVDQRKKIFDLQFKYAEASRDPKTTVEQLDKIGKETIELQDTFYQKMPANCRR